MKKRVLTILGIYSVLVILSGIYIISTIQISTSKLHNLVKLYQIETKRKSLLLKVKNVQSDLNLRQTPYARGVDSIIENVQLMEGMANECFMCHHSDAVVAELQALKQGIENYKSLISRVLTFRANAIRLKHEDAKAFHIAEQLFDKINSMIHMATVRLSDKTRSSLRDIFKSNMILFILVGITPFFAIGLGFVFVKGLTRPVQKLLGATRKLEEGDLTHRIEGLEDEFGQVAESFNKMASRVESYTNRLQQKTGELERAHQEMSTFCQVLKLIGVQQTLDGVARFLMQEIRNILAPQDLRLFVLSSDQESLFVLSDLGIETTSDPDAVKPALAYINAVDRLTVATKKRFEHPLLPESMSSSAYQSVVPFNIKNYTHGLLVVACQPDCLCDENKLGLIALILEHASGTIKRAILHTEEMRLLEGRTEKVAEFGGIVGKDPKMQVIYKLIEDIADTEATVLIQGETGTGKEVVARALHQQSQRRNKPFVVVNCAAYPSTLLESELFGHEKGAFTGAIRKKIGRFEQAHGGTVFLDEIGEISLSAQIKLLRVIQTQKFERLGGEETVHVDVRILAATNKDLLQQVKNGHFREDLYYRLNVIPIDVPPLRARPNDIPLLARFFQRKFAAETGNGVKDFSGEAMRLLLDYPWPGNVRELENSVEHAVVLSKGNRIEVSHLPSSMATEFEAPSPEAKPNNGGGMSIVDHEKRLLIEVLEGCNWNKSVAAQTLGISRSTLYGKIKKYKVVQPN